MNIVKYYEKNYKNIFYKKIYINYKDNILNLGSFSNTLFLRLNDLEDKVSYKYNLTTGERSFDDTTKLVNLVNDFYTSCDQVNNFFPKLFENTKIEKDGYYAVLSSYNSFPHPLFYYKLNVIKVIKGKEYLYNEKFDVWVNISDGYLYHLISIKQLDDIYYFKKNIYYYFIRELEKI